MLIILTQREGIFIYLRINHINILLIQFTCHLKTGTFLHPLFGADASVSVAVGTQIPVSAHPAAGVIHQQRSDKHPQRVFLPFGTRICGTITDIQSAFITNTDAVRIVAQRMCSRLL